MAIDLNNRRAETTRKELESYEGKTVIPSGNDAADMQPTFVTNLRPRDDSGGIDYVTRSQEWRDGGNPTGPDKFERGAANMKRGGEMKGKGW